MTANVSPKLDMDVTVGKILNHLTKLLDRLEGIETSYDDGMESRNVMMLANGMHHKLKEELKNDRALLFGLIFWGT